MKNQYVIGLDYGTDSVRAVIVNAVNGEEVASDVYLYPRWAEGKYCDPGNNRFRQHPLDYLEGFELINREKNFRNEVEILHSIPMIRETILDLNLLVSY